MTKNNYSKEYIKLKNLEAEQSILGELLANPDRALSQINELNPRHFFDNKNRKLFNKILELDKEGRTIDIVNLSQYNIFQVLGLNDLMQKAVSPVKVSDYEALIIDQWMRRQIYKASNEIKNQITQIDNEPAQVISETVSKFDKIQQTETDGQELGDIKPVIEKLINQRVDGIENNPGVKTGYRGYDYRTGGLKPGDLITIGAGTNTGKTALSLNIIENIIFRDNKPPTICYLTLEMPTREVTDRIITTRAKIDINRLHRDQLTDKDKAKYQKIAQQIYEKPLKILQPKARLSAIETKIDLLKRRYNPKIIFVDNLQNILGGRVDQYRMEITAATRTLKALALKHNTTIIMLSHFNRGDGNPTDRPTLNKLRESGSIEADSDKVILIHRPEKGLTLNTYKENCKLLLAKNRQGHTADIEVIFNRKTARFENKPQDNDPGF
ncbi:MAG: replicative DNA helicase [Candidatus Marinimicrobia bacterium]|nr:replicative DNA helicase [Candidatus Neomarinimicrobiota bacterium]